MPLQSQSFYITMQSWLRRRISLPVTRALPFVQFPPPPDPHVDFSHLPRVVVIGGGVAGLAAASALVKVWLQSFKSVGGLIFVFLHFSFASFSM